MNLKRLFRLAAISGAVAAAVAAIRALTRDDDPLPAPADGPTEPWPPLRTATTGTATPSATRVPDEVEPADGGAAEVADTPDGTPDEALDDTTADAGPVAEPAVSEPGPAPEPEPVASEPEPAAEEKPTESSNKRRRDRPLRAPWMPPNDDGSCPDGYPLKANDQSMIFHAPGQMSYDRTVPERCYAEAEVAIADGYRAAKR